MMIVQTRYAVHLSEHTHTIDGVTRPNPAPLWETPLPELIAQILRLVYGLGTVLVDPGAALRLGLPTGDTPPTGADAKVHPFALALRAANYRIKEVGRWFHVKHRDHGEAWFGLVHQFSPDHFPMLAEPEPMTAALAQWHRSGGVPWHGGAGDAGNAIMRTVSAEYKEGKRMMRPVWWSHQGPEGHPIESAYLPFQWVRPEPGVGTAWGFDRVRAYLAAMTCTPVAGEALTHDGRTAFAPKQSGWWMVELDEWHYHHLMPDPAGYSDDIEGQPPRTRWLTTPRVQLLADLAAEGLYSYRVLDSWTAPSTQVVIRYAKQLREMWDGTMIIADPVVRQLVRAGIKGAYQAGHGYMRSKQSDVQRGDYAAAITAMSAANTWRACWKAGWRSGGPLGPWPMWIDTDNVFYGGDTAPMPAMWDWTVWDGGRSDLDDVTKLGHWRSAGTRNVSRETGLPVRARKVAKAI